MSLGNGGRITLEFTDNLLTGSDDASKDLRVFEVGAGEVMFVEISVDGIVWSSVGIAGFGIDIDAFGFGSADTFTFVRLTDNGGGAGTSYVGADIDAVGAIGAIVERVPADFNNDNIVDHLDIDLLRDAINTSSTDPQFNVNGDSSLDVGDLSHLVTTIIGTTFGDTDLNFVVNFNDWTNLSNNFGKSGTGWAQANFMLDNQTDFLDFVILTNNFGTVLNSQENVPEPMTVTLILGALITLTNLERSRSLSMTVISAEKSALLT